MLLLFLFKTIILSILFICILLFYMLYCSTDNEFGEIQKGMKKIPGYSVGMFIGTFVGILVLMTITFDFLAFIYRPVLLVPISYSGYGILKILGAPLSFTGPLGIPGFCEYRLPHYTLVVTFGCTGIYALFILLAGIIAFPKSLKIKLMGILLAVPSFYVYSILRLVIIGAVGNWFPDWIDFVHSYLMEIINIAFVMSIFVLWIRYAEKHSKTV